MNVRVAVNDADQDDVRQRLQDEVTRRWTHVAREVKRAILQNDALSIGDKAPRLAQPVADKALMFKRWLDEKLTAGVAGYDGSWLGPSIDAAASRGARRVAVGDAGFDPGQPRDDHGRWGLGGVGGVGESTDVLVARYKTQQHRSDFKPDPGRPIGAEAKSYVLQHGRETSTEYLVAIDKTGKPVDVLAGDKSSVAFTGVMDAAAGSPIEAMVIHHNHPSSTSLSGPDISQLAKVGIAAIWAHGNNGRSYRAELTDQAKVAVKRAWDHNLTDDMQRKLYAAHERASEVIHDAVGPQLYSPDKDKQSTLTGIASLNHSGWVNSALHQAGIIKYHSDTENMEAETALSFGIEGAIGEAAFKARELFYGKGSANRADRSAEPVRLTGELGLAFGEAQEPARRHAAQDGDDRLGRAAAAPDVERQFGDQQQLAFLEHRRPPSAGACHAATAGALAGICADVATQAHDGVARALLGDARPMQVARLIDQAMGHGLMRTRMLAEHAVTMAYSQATLDALEAAGVTHVGTISEGRGVSDAEPDEDDEVIVEGQDGARFRVVKNARGEYDVYAIDFDPDQPRDEVGRWTGQTATPEFKAWFGASKAVDKDSRPLRLFHGSDRDFASFEGSVLWFSASPSLASEYASTKASLRRDIGASGEGASVYPVFLRIEHPLSLKGNMNDKVTYSSFRKSVGFHVPVMKYGDETVDGVEQKYKTYQIVNSSEFVEAAKQAGYDGVVVREGRALTYGAFHPEQVKSAIGNKGAFNPTSPRIVDFDPDEPRDEIGRWTTGGAATHAGYEFVSPNVEQHPSLAAASSAAASPRQAAMLGVSHEVDAALGLKATDKTIIGAWSDGAENSVLTLLPEASWDQVRLSAAMKGHVGDQKQVLAFKQDDAGDAVLYNFHAKGTLDAIHQSLLADGVSFHTLAPSENGADVYVVDTDGQAHDAVERASQRANAPITYQRGRAEFLGSTLETGTDREIRDDARRAYEEVIRQSPVPNGAEVWARHGDRWGAALAAASPGRPGAGEAGGAGGGAGLRAAQASAAEVAEGHPPLKGLPQNPIELDGALYVPGPIGRIRDAAERYMAGKAYAPPDTYVKLDKERAGRIASAYDAMPNAPDDPAVKASYAAMTRETLAQWQEVKRSGLKVEWIAPGQADPYASNPRAAAMDVAKNNHWWGYPTDLGYGSEDATSRANNPMLQDSGEVIGGRKALVNDVFRVVHDYFGHFKEGNGFRAEGEDNAWRSHASMFSKEALPAMTAETRGQNSWVNYGPYGETNRKASAGDTHYAPQKIGIMPDWTFDDIGKGRPVSDAFDAWEWVEDYARTTPQPKHPKTGKFARAHVVARELRRSKRTGRFRKQGLDPAEQRKEELAEARFSRVRGKLDVVTAGDDRVCDDCDAISDGGPYTINAARGLIPAHPNCRCLFVAAGAMRDAFDPDQPRDPQGRWTALAGSSGHYALVSTAPITATGRAGSEQATELAAAKNRYTRIDMALLDKDKDAKRKMVELFRDPEMFPMVRADEWTGDTDKDARLIIDRMKSNLNAMWSDIDPKEVASWRKWYDGAHSLIGDRMKQYEKFGIDRASMTAVYAAQSPNTEWDVNVHLGDRLLDTVLNHSTHAFDGEMRDAAKAQIDNTVKGIADKEKKTGKPAKQARQNLADMQQLFTRIEGKTLKELTALNDQAAWIKLYNDAHDTEPLRQVNVDGTFGEIRRKKPTPAMARRGEQGEPMAGAFGTLDRIANALTALNSHGDANQLSEAVGDKHKVRSFYNNMLDPKSANDDVTIDTHAGGAAWMFPFGGKDTQVQQMLGGSVTGGKAPPSSAVTGIKGTYPFYADAYREFAHEAGRLTHGREAQSVLWMKKIQMFRNVTDANKALAWKAWTDYHDGKQSLAKTQAEILRIAKS